MADRQIPFLIASRTGKGVLYTVADESIASLSEAEKETLRSQMGNLMNVREILQKYLDWVEIELTPDDSLQNERRLETPA